MSAILRWFHFWLVAARTDALRLVRSADAPARFLGGCGLVLVASGLFHIIVLLVLGGSWEGAVSWRKPILFGISTGVTCLSLAFALGLCRWPGNRAAWLSGLFGSAALVEVGIITLQTWRGLPSHFNTSTASDTVLTALLDGLTLLLLLIILVITAASLTALRKDRLPPSAALALRAGLLWLSAACLFGLWMVIYGQQRVALGQPPEIYGVAGVMKFVHGMPIHALQWLPLLAWALAKGRGSWTEPSRTRLVAFANTGIALQTLFAVLQTFAGRARQDVTPFTAILLALGLAAFALPWAIALLNLPQPKKPPQPETR